MSESTATAERQYLPFWADADWDRVFAEETYQPTHRAIRLAGTTEEPRGLLVGSMGSYPHACAGSVELIDMPSADAFGPFDGPQAMFASPNVIRCSLTKCTTSAAPFRLGRFEGAVGFTASTSAPADPSYQESLKLAFRLAELQADAEEEGIAISEGSQRDLLRFLGTHLDWRRPSLFLLDSGNFRALWRSGREQIALQFLGNQMIQYVIFRECPGAPDDLASSHGHDSFHGIEQLIPAFGVERLIRR